MNNVSHRGDERFFVRVESANRFVFENTVELGYIGSQQTAKLIRYIRGNFHCFVLIWEPEILSDISDYPI